MGGSLALNGASARCAPDDRAQTARDQAVCGPRCARQILASYGQDVDLIALINEMQDGIVEQPSNVRAIQVALEKRGVYAKPVKIGLLTFPDWPQPIVMHYERGHFVVLEGSKGGYARIRDGVAMEPTWSFIPWVMLSQSRVVLLTSDRPIERELQLIQWPRWALAFGCVGIGGIGLLIRHHSLTALSAVVSSKAKENVT